MKFIAPKIHFQEEILLVDFGSYSFAKISYFFAILYFFASEINLVLISWSPLIYIG